MSEKPEEKIELTINCHTWLKNTEDLFDFETSNISDNEFSFTNFDKDYFIIKYENNQDNDKKEKIDFINNNNILRQKLNSNLNENNNINNNKVLGLMKYNRIKSTIKIINSFKSRKFNNFHNLFKPENCERLYELLPMNEYININEGDIIKVGRIRMKFDKISFKSKARALYENIEQDYEKEEEQKINNIQETKEVIDTSVNKVMITSMPNPSTELKPKYICRLCYSSESTITDPLISPCNCNGSMKYIHLSCLKNSIKLKYHKKKCEFYELYLFQNYSCEICLSPYPKYIIYKSQIYYLIDLDITKFDNYVICDLNLYSDNNNNHLTRFGVLIFKIEEGLEIPLGRKKSNNIKLKDISVSRKHCLIRKKGNDLLIKDLGSKFGTMKYIKDFYEIKLKERAVLLSGKHELEFLLDKSWNKFSFSSMFDFMCCTCNQPINENSEIVIYSNGFKISDDNYEDNNDIKNNNEFTDRKNNKINYLSKFKDNDSYNDYIIKMDNIIGLDNTFLEKKDEEDNNGNDNENLNSQLKEKEDSFINY